MREYSASLVRLQATSEHCICAFDTLLGHYSNPGTRQDFATGLGIENAQCPLFVTWNTACSETASPRGVPHWRLRGCIGTLEPRNLRTALQDYALTSALRDTRFSPIRITELPDLKCVLDVPALIRTVHTLQRVPRTQESLQEPINDVRGHTEAALHREPQHDTFSTRVVFLVP